MTLPLRYTSRTIPWGSDSSQIFRLPTINTNNIFSSDEDPSDIMHLISFDLRKSKTAPYRKTLTADDTPLYFSLLDHASCYTTMTPRFDPPLIIDTGASVCITPQKSDFDTYRSSDMRIKDLSSSNKVAGEGQISWHVVNTDGNQITISLPGFHIPTAEVRLLSPQLLLEKSGGYSHQTSSKIQIYLDSGKDIEAHYCPRTKLPMLRLVNGKPRTRLLFTG